MCVCLGMRRLYHRVGERERERERERDGVADEKLCTRKRGETFRYVSV